MYFSQKPTIPTTKNIPKTTKIFHIESKYPSFEQYIEGNFSQEQLQRVNSKQNHCMKTAKHGTNRNISPFSLAEISTNRAHGKIFRKLDDRTPVQGNSPGMKKRHLQRTHSLPEMNRVTIDLTNDTNDDKENPPKFTFGPSKVVKES
jgi:hypothetical protein